MAAVCVALCWFVTCHVGFVYGGPLVSHWRDIQRLDGASVRSLLDVAIYVGTGYDLLRGNPDGVSLTSGGMDPGLKVAKPVLHQTKQPEGCILEANCVRFESAFNDEQSSTETDMRSFQTSSDKSWSVEGKVGIKLFSARGGASQSSKEMHDEFQKRESVLVSKRNLTILGEIAYGYHEFTRLSNNFMSAICRLPNDYVQNDYISFIREWGTHVVTSARFGTRSTYRLIVSKSEFMNAVMKSKTSSWSAGGSFGSFASVDMSSSMSKSMSEVLMNSASQSSIGNLTLGTEDRPAPITFTLRPIDFFVSDQYLRTSLEYVKDCPLLKPGNNSRVSQHLARALEEYPALEGVDLNSLAQVNRSLDPEWPHGQYSLLKNGGACPEGWANGTRRLIFDSLEQDLNAAPVGYQAVPHTDSGWSDWTASFCTKRVDTESNGNDVNWQPGSYCIFRKGGVCPEGFPGTGTLSALYLASENWNGFWHTTLGNIGDETNNSSLVNQTNLEYCCRDDGPVDRGLFLPVTTSFTLLPIGKACQRVSGMKSSLKSLSTEADIELPMPLSTAWAKATFLGYAPQAEPAPYEERDKPHLQKHTVFLCEYQALPA